ncbi:hypothetical protein SNL152K_4747 [Streptomyces sp. NL15-2K]|nr:hypothetical protein SNL152K_4747 [Streptomyces sp. NL15-2K]
MAVQQDELTEGESPAMGSAMGSTTALGIARQYADGGSATAGRARTSSGAMPEGGSAET